MRGNPETLTTDLFALLPLDRVYLDTNGDGFPDELRLGICIFPGMNHAGVWAEILNLTARLAFGTLALDPDLVARTTRNRGVDLVLLPPGRIEVGGDFQPGLLARLAWDEKRRSLHLMAHEPEGHKSMIRLMAMDDGSLTGLGMDWAWLELDRSGRITARDENGGEIGSLATGEGPVHFADAGWVWREPGRVPDLLDLTGPDGLFQVSSKSPLARGLNLALELPSDRLNPELGLALCEWVARATLEATELRLPLAFAGRGPRDAQVVVRVEPGGDGPGRIDAGILGRRQEIVLSGAPPRLARAVRAWNGFAFKSSGPGTEGIRNMRERAHAFRAIAAGHGFWGGWARNLAANRNPKQGWPLVSGKNHALLSRAYENLGLAPPPASPGKSPLRRSVSWVGELNEVETRIKALEPGRGVLSGLILVSKPLGRRRALKKKLVSMLSAKGYQPVLRVLNAYKPGFSWLMEEVLPALKKLPEVERAELSYSPFSEPDCLELSSRWLEEAFPAPELVCRAMGRGPEWLALLKNRDLPSAYLFRAWDNKGDVVLCEEFTPFWGSLEYFQGKKAYPCRCGVLLELGGGVLMRCALPTDREKFWRIFQREWLPLLQGQMDARLGEEDYREQPAFWREIKIEVEVEESDLRLDLDEERICPMEALHEDLYFGLLAFFEEFSRARGLDQSTRLGRVIPVVRAHTTKERPLARLRALPLDWPRAPIWPGGGEPPTFRALTRSSGVWMAELAWDMGAGEAETFAAVARGLGFKAEVSGKWGPLILSLQGHALPLIGKAKKNATGLPPLDRRLEAREVGDWILALGGMKNLAAWPAGVSWQGRRVWALEATLEVSGDVSSLARLRLVKPTLLINARHHANEISSTNAALRMAWLLSQSPVGEAWLKKLNVALIPLENADGVATLEELLPGARDHKLHAARYNALGVEYYADYYENPPRFPDAQAKAALFERWLPRLSLDAHGVPSHEWDQPFAGLAPAGFQEFWLPRTMIFAYIPYIDEPAHPGHGKARELEADLMAAYEGDEEIRELNQRLAERYRRYALGPEPETFPPSAGAALEILPVLGRIKKTNLAMRRPDITVSEVITEVTDEVVSGPLLALCCRAQLKAMESMIKNLLRNVETARTYLYSNREGLHLAWRYSGQGDKRSLDQ